MWIDLYQGEPIETSEMLADLAGVRVVYLGERHTLKRHHEVQTRIVEDLGRRGVKLVLGLEQMEAQYQPALDCYAKGEITFAKLGAITQWAKRWPGYQAYQPVLEAARRQRAPILALNARRETIHQLARRGGVAKLGPQMRKELPAQMDLRDPCYEKFLGLEMMVHMAASPERLRPMIEAQIARDETMADHLASFLRSPAGRGRTAVVLCGEGHVVYGLGTPARLRRRLPGVKDRIILLSESGDVELSPAELKEARSVTITHEQLRQIDRPIGDYLQATTLRPVSGCSQP